MYLLARLADALPTWLCLSDRASKLLSAFEFMHFLYRVLLPISSPSSFALTIHPDASANLNLNGLNVFELFQQSRGGATELAQTNADVMRDPT